MPLPRRFPCSGRVYSPSNQHPVGPNDLGGIPSQLIDVVGLDIYPWPPNGTEAGYTRADYNKLSAIADGRPLALAENGLAPQEDVLANQRYAWFLMWGGYETRQEWDHDGQTNTPEMMQALYDNPRVITKGLLPYDDYV